MSAVPLPAYQPSGEVSSSAMPPWVTGGAWPAWIMVAPDQPLVWRLRQDNKSDGETLRIDLASVLRLEGCCSDSEKRHLATTIAWTLWLVSTVVFVVMRLSGDPVPLLLPPDAPISEMETTRVRELAAEVFRLAGCSGLARCDFFVEPDGTVLVNEINTMPGFTETSVYAKLLEADGLSYPDLCDRLVALAIARHERARSFEF